MAIILDAAEIRWDKWAVIVATAQLLLTVLIVIWANRLAMKYWRKQKKEEIDFQLHGLKAEAYLDAAKAAWALLAYVTEKENGKCLLIYKGTKDKPEIYFHLERGKEYLHRLSQMFYDEGHGIFLTKEIKHEIFHIRTNVYRIIDKENRRGVITGEVLLENKELIEFFRGSYEKLRQLVGVYVLKIKYDMENLD